MCVTFEQLSQHGLIAKCQFGLITDWLSTSSDTASLKMELSPSWHHYQFQDRLFNVGPLSRPASRTAAGSTGSHGSCWVMSTTKEDLQASSAELVYGQKLQVPGNFIHNTFGLWHNSWPRSWTKRVFAPVPLSQQGLLQSHVPVTLQSAEYLFIYQDAWRPGTKPLDSCGKLEHVTVNCDKPAHLVVDRTVGLRPPWQRWPPTIAPWHCKLLWQRLRSLLQCYRALPVIRSRHIEFLSVLVNLGVCYRPHIDRRIQFIDTSFYVQKRTVCEDDKCVDKWPEVCSHKKR